MRTTASAIRHVLGAAACAFAVVASLTAGVVPAYASGTGGGGETGGGNDYVQRNYSYVWSDGGTYDTNGKLVPNQGWNEASAEAFIDKMEAVVGRNLTTSGVDGEGVSYRTKYMNAANEALSRARARAGTTDARVVGVGWCWWVTGAGNFAFAHHTTENTFARLLPRAGNSSELPDANGWGGNYRDTGKTWRQAAYDQGATDNPGADYVAVVVAVADTEPQAYGTIEVNKTEADADVVVNNVNYSLENCKFGIYRDKGCTDLVTTITTDRSGRGTARVLAGTYYMKEIDPPVGHISSDGVWTLVVTPGNTVTQDVSEEATTVDVDVTKTIAGAEGNAVGDVSLKGAQIRLTVDTTGDKQPERTFVFESDAKGDFNVDTGAGLVSGDALWYDGTQNIAWPLGTYTVQEIKAPGGLLLEGQTDDSPKNYTAPVHTFDCTEGEGATVSLESGIEEPVDFIPIDVEKVDKDRLEVWEGDTVTDVGVPQGNSTLENCEIVFKNACDNNVIFNGELIAPDEEVTRVSTNAHGLASLELMVGRYEVYETKAPKGYQVNPTHYLLTITPTGTTFAPIA